MKDSTGFSFSTLLIMIAGLAMAQTAYAATAATAEIVGRAENLVRANSLAPGTELTSFEDREIETMLARFNTVLEEMRPVITRALDAIPTQNFGPTTGTKVSSFASTSSAN